jgi:hypothetical protein
MAQKCLVLSFFLLQMTIQMTIAVKNVLFLAKKIPLLALITLLRPSRTFLGKKIANYSKIYFSK